MTTRRRRRPNQISDKRRAQFPERDAVVEQARERDRDQCRARELVPEVRCSGPLDPHEIIPRSAWSAGWLVLENILSVCRGHHRWIDNHPDAAHALGLHGYSWERTR